MTNRANAHLYILAGQSNMDGMGSVGDLPAKLSTSQKDTWIYNPNRREDQQPVDDRGFWELFRPGHGSGYRTDGKKSYYSNSFGPELSFAVKMRKVKPERTILIFKYAKGGSSIHADAATEWGCWDPDYNRGNGINQWTHFRYHLHRSIDCAEKKFGKLHPAGILWHQGESDASHSKNIAEAYEENLRKVISAIYSEMDEPVLPVVIGEISESWKSEESNDGKALRHVEIVQEAQRMFVEEEPLARLVSPPEGHGFIDAWHYDSQTYIDLGIRFADAIMELEKEIVRN